MKILVTGGAGFIGSNFIHYLIKEHSDWDITNLDKLTYAGNPENLAGIEKNPRYHFTKGDITDRQTVSQILSQGFDVLVNFAAESHVDRSIMDASPFIDTNIKGTQVLLEGVKQYGIIKYLQVSTDEVYGSTEIGKFNENSPLFPNSPYAASKASADLLSRAYWRTFNLPVVITRCSNNYGPYQFPEKLIPLLITNAMENKDIPVYGDGLNIREWIHVIDHCRAIDYAIKEGKCGEIYNVGSNEERTNIELVKFILGVMGKPQSLIKYVTDRPGHDRRYALDSQKIQNELTWKPTISFEDGMVSTVKWYLNNKSWWQHVKSGEYAQYYHRMYDNR